MSGCLHYLAGSLARRVGGRFSSARHGSQATRLNKRLAYTLIEMLTTIAVLVIVMGLMSSLARRVRAQSADRVTKSLLRSLDSLMAQYVKQHGAIPVIPPLLPDLKDSQLPEESTLQINALRNNRELLRVLRSQLRGNTGTGGGGGLFSDQPASIDNDLTLLRDAWRTPIVFMPSFHPAIGTAPGDHFFFVSAGPDGHFLTRDDNLYSYEVPAEK